MTDIKQDKWGSGNWVDEHGIKVWKNPVSDVADIVKFAQEFQESAYYGDKRPKQLRHVYFRGEPKDYGETALTPQLLRDKSVVSEESLFSRAITYANNFPPGLLYSSRSAWKLDALVVLQHHGLATRLLDWSRNIGTASYFALDDRKPECHKGNPKNKCHKEQPKPEEDFRCIYALASAKLNEFTVLKSGDNTVNILGRETYGALFRSGFIGAIDKNEWIANIKGMGYDYDKTERVMLGLAKNEKNERAITEALFDKMRIPAAFVGMLSGVIDNRLYQQQSVFTLHGGIYSRGDLSEGCGHVSLQDLQKNNPETTFVAKLKIKNAHQDKLRAQLKFLGIDGTSVFSDPVTVNKSLYDELSDRKGG